MPDIHQIFDAALLGVIEGLTEFLPISSTGHLIIADKIIGFQGPAGNFFEVVIQLGAILAVCFLFRQKIIDIIKGLGGKGEARHTAITVTIAFLPSVVLGLLLHKWIKEVLFSPLVVAITMLLGGFIILLVERMQHKFTAERMEDISYKTALKIGFFQCLAMVPGTSRSGATIIGGMLMGVSRKAAAEFSFFLAIPTMMGATALDLYKNRSELTPENLDIIAVGFITAFISALIIVKWFIRFISTHDFKPFAWYRIAAGLILLTWVLGFN